MKLFKVPVVNCPSCSQKIYMASVTGMNTEIAPEEDNYTICCYCFAPLQFNSDLTVRKADQVPDQVRFEIIRLKALMRTLKAGLN